MFRLRPDAWNTGQGGTTGDRDSGRKGPSHSLGPTLNSGLPYPRHSTRLCPGVLYLVTGTTAMNWLSRLQNLPLGTSYSNQSLPSPVSSASYTFLLDRAPGAATWTLQQPPNWPPGLSLPRPQRSSNANLSSSLLCLSPSLPLRPSK